MERERSSASSELREAISADASYGSGPRPEARGAPTAALRSGFDGAAGGDAASHAPADGGATRRGSSGDGAREDVSADASYEDGDPRADGLGGRSTAGLRSELDATGVAPTAPVDPTRREQSAADGTEAIAADVRYASGQQSDEFGSTAGLRGELNAAGVRPEAPQDLARRGDQVSRDRTGPADASYADGAAEGGFGGVSTAELRGAFDAAGRPLRFEEQSSRSPAGPAGQAGAGAAPDGGTAEAAGALSPAAAREFLEAAGAHPEAPGAAGGESVTGATEHRGGPQPFASSDLGSWPLQGDVSGHRLQGGDVGNHRLGGEVGNHHLQGSVGSHKLNNDAGNGVPGAPSVADQNDPANQQLQPDDTQPDDRSGAQRAGADPQPSQPASMGQHSSGDSASPAAAPGPAAHPSQVVSPSTALEAGRSDQAPSGLARTVSLSEGMAGACSGPQFWYTAK